MQIKIQAIVDDEHGEVITEDILVLDKSSEGDGLIGMSLSESKQLFKRLQQVIVTPQVNHYTHTHRNCPHCDKKQRIKGTYDIQYRTLFGIVPRFCRKQH